jgi:hydroxyethylthiazole kinase-like uncharacterized protein yjeF
MMEAAIKQCILTTAQMAEADQICIAELETLGRSGADLMEEAGLSVVRVIQKRFNGNKVLVLCGPGNNGGDGFVIARHLRDSGWHVHLALLGDVNNLKGDAARMAERWQGDIENIYQTGLEGFDVIVDAIFGTGLCREISGDLKEVFENINTSDAIKIAVDIPSGVDGNTGKILGSVIRADRTITFCRLKPAHVLYPSKEICGEITIADIGIPDRVVHKTNPDIFVNCPSLWQHKLPNFSGDFHKYDRGHAVIVGGDRTHTGAGRLAAMAALRIGAGLVSVSCPDDAMDINAAHLTIIMLRKRTEIISDLDNDKLNCWCIGPASGVNEVTKADVLRILEADKHAVLDADALSVFEDNPELLYEKLSKNGRVVLTPHAGEFARIFPGIKNLDKLSTAKEAARMSNSVVLYKGADTVIAAPDGRTVISNKAAPFLATAGTGDVLAGLISGLLAQRMNAFEAACAGQWIHSECANEFGEGLISEDLLLIIPRVLKRLK